jgi:nucleotide-binding universal stress UspA family protein
MAGEIVLGYDGQGASQAALRSAVSLAGAYKLPLVVAFGYAPSAMGGEVADLAESVQALGRKITDDAVREIHAIDASVEVKTELVNDRPAEAVLRAAAQYEAFMIVVGSTGRGPIAGALLGSVSNEIVLGSKCPVLVVPLPGED